MILCFRVTPRSPNLVEFTNDTDVISQRVLDALNAVGANTSEVFILIIDKS